MPVPPASRAHSALLLGVGLALIALLSIAPLLQSRPIHFVAPSPSTAARTGQKAFVLLAMGLAIFAAVRSESRRGAASARALAFAAIAAALTACHWSIVELRHSVENGHPNYFQADWQRKTYLAILNGQRYDVATDAHTLPHLFRPLPYGFVRALELATGDWWFSCLAYRWFFTFWFMWFYETFARLFRSPGRALLALAVYPVLYLLSIRYYGGQLTDPLSHALFALSLVLIIEDRWALLAAAVALGVLSKETAVVLVPGYLACHWRKGFGAVVRTALVGVAAVIAFAAARLPYDLRRAMSETPLNLAWNLGIGPLPPFPESVIHENWIQPLLFVGVFLAIGIVHWRSAEPPLKALTLTLTPLVLISQLLYGWLYESRNYVPLLPVLTTLAVTPRRDAGSRDKSDLDRSG